MDLYCDEEDDDDPWAEQYDPDSECYETADEPEPEPERDYVQEWKDDKLRPAQEEPSDLDWYGDDDTSAEGH